MTTPDNEQIKDTAYELKRTIVNVTALIVLIVTIVIYLKIFGKLDIEELPKWQRIFIFSCYAHSYIVTLRYIQSFAY